MSYTTYRDRPASEKIVLVEIDAMEDVVFVNLTPGLWLATYSVYKEATSFNFGSGAFGFGAFGTAGTATLTNDRAAAASINSFYAGTEWYARTTGLATVRATPKSFYFDPVTSFLYVHFEDHDPPDTFADLKAGAGRGYATKSAYYDGIFYDGRVLSVPNITRSKDPLFFGKISFDGGTVALINSDGEFDTWVTDYSIYGAAVRVLLGFEDNTYADMKTLYEGYLENVRVSEDVLELQVNDKRKALSRKVPPNVFDMTTYPNLKAENANKPIPLGYGVIKNAPVICTNENGTTPWTFKIVDTTHRGITAIDAVYVEGGTARTSVVWDAGNLAAATFALTAGTYTATKDKVTVDFQGYASGGVLISNGLEIMRDILSTYYAKSYSGVFYNTTAWGSAEAVAADIGLLVHEPTEGWKLIEEISYSLRGNFIVQDDGLFTFRAFDSTRATAQSIAYTELLGDLEVAYNTDELLSSCRVGHTKDWEKKTHTELLYTTGEAEIAEEYKLYRERTFETLLTAAGSAGTFAAGIMEIAGAARGLFRVRTKLQSVDREISDIITVAYRGPNRAFVGTVNAEVIGKTVDLDAMEVELQCRIL